jgi:hypothetical protein
MDLPTKKTPTKKAPTEILRPKKVKSRKTKAKKPDGASVKEEQIPTISKLHEPVIV